MVFEVGMAVAMLLMAAMAVMHSLGTRPRRHTLMLLVTGIGFGYVFPLVDINLFKHYVFHGRFTLLNIPFHLGVAWYALLYMSLRLAELLLGRETSRRRLSLLAGGIFGLLEAQWDPTLLKVGMMELFLPSFASYPLGFHCGVPMFHVYVGFFYAYGFVTLRDGTSPVATNLASVGTLTLSSLSMMAAAPMMVPMFDYFSPRLDRYVLIIMDAFHFSTSFLFVGLFVAWWLRWIGRRLGGAQA